MQARTLETEGTPGQHLWMRLQGIGPSSARAHATLCGSRTATPRAARRRERPEDRRARCSTGSAQRAAPGTDTRRRRGGQGGGTDSLRSCRSHPVAKLVPDTPPTPSRCSVVCGVDVLRRAVRPVGLGEPARPRRHHGLYRAAQRASTRPNDVTTTACQQHHGLPQALITATPSSPARPLLVEQRRSFGNVVERRRAV